MVNDDVLQEIRATRDALAESHKFDVRALVADLQARNAVGDWPVVSHPPRRRPTEDKPQDVPAEPEPMARK